MHAFFAVNLVFLNEIVALFIVSVLIAYVCYRLGLAPIVGFLLAGVAIGPSALGLVQNRELVDILAEVGVILLLFTIGIEFSLEKLSRLMRAIFVGGSLQVVFTILLVIGALLAFGVDWRTALYTGFLVSLSSTAIVLGLLVEREETDSPSGKLSLAILIFQDFAIIAMVLAVPMLTGDGVTAIDIIVVFGKALLLIAGILVLARRAVPWILEHVAHTRRQELFLLTVVTICFGTAAASSALGVSVALGAFLAGLIVSGSRYGEHALTEILPLRTIFNAVFFVSVGMLLDLNFLFDNWLILLAGAGIVMIIKIVTTTGSVLILGYPIRVAATTGLVLAQIGEFSFVLERAGRTAGLTPAGLGEVGVQSFIAATVLLMMFTPFQISLAHRFGSFVSRGPLRRLRPEHPIPENKDADDPMEDHVVIVGYGHAGKRLVQVLRDRGIPFIVIEMDPTIITSLRDEGVTVVIGDASRTNVLQHARIRSAKLCVVVVNDLAISPRIIQEARNLNPTLQIIARARHLSDLERLQKLGADVVVAEEMETTVRIFSHVLGAYMIPPDEVERQTRGLRSEDYRVMRGSIQEAHMMVLQGLDEEGMHTRAVAVRDGAYAAGKTLQELAIRRDYELTVLAIRRGGKTIASPAGTFEIMAGDRLVMVGAATRFAAAAELFRSDAKA